MHAVLILIIRLPLPFSVVWNVISIFMRNVTQNWSNISATRIRWFYVTMKRRRLMMIKFAMHATNLSKRGQQHTFVIPANHAIFTNLVLSCRDGSSIASTKMFSLWFILQQADNAKLVVNTSMALLITAALAIFIWISTAFHPGLYWYSEVMSTSLPSLTSYIAIRCAKAAAILPLPTPTSICVVWNAISTSISGASPYQKL